MNLDYVPLLPVMRALQGIARGQPPDFNGKKRFKQYLREIFDYDRKVIKLLPLLAMNPMGKDHVTALLDAYLAIDADGIGARVAAEVAARLADVPGDFKVGLVVCDDLMGGGSNRYEQEFAFRFGPGPGRSIPSAPKPSRWLKDYWLQGVLWSSEPASERAVRESILTATHRVAYMHQHGPARTLREMLTQEGQVMALAGCVGPTLDAEDIAYTREVLAPFLEADDMRTCIECLFGDAAARTLGLTPPGLSPWAGLALALHDARAKETPRRSGPASRRSVAQVARRARRLKWGVMGLGFPMNWVPYDPSMLIALAANQLPDETWLPRALSACRQCHWESRAYAHFVDGSNPNKPGSEWQFVKNLRLSDPKVGEIILDVLTGNRIGGIEFLNRL